LYDDGHYHEAAQAFNSLLLQKDEQLIRFYYANALMASGEVPESIKQFEIYLEDNPILKDEATWYVALGYLHENQKDKTSAFLMDLTNLNTALGDQATDLLNEMR